MPFVLTQGRPFPNTFSNGLLCRALRYSRESWATCYKTRAGNFLPCLPTPTSLSCSCSCFCFRLVASCHSQLQEGRGGMHSTISVCLPQKCYTLPHMCGPSWSRPPSPSRISFDCTYCNGHHYATRRSLMIWDDFSPG